MIVTFRSVTPMIPTMGPLAEALSFYRDHMGFEVLWESDGGAGIVRGDVAFNLVVNDSREWANNSSYSIGVVGLDALHETFRSIPARVGPLEIKPWGRREFHMIVPSGLCFQFYEAAPAP